MEQSGSLYGRGGSRSGVLIWDEGGVGLEEWLRWSAHLLGDAVCRVQAQYSALLPTPYFCSELLRSGSWDFGLFVSCP